MALRCAMVSRSRCAGGRGETGSASESSSGPMISVSGVLNERKGKKDVRKICVGRGKRGEEKRGEEMGRDGKRWEEMGRDGKRWEEMGRDGKRWEEGERYT